MYALNTQFSRKAKKGRPLKFKTTQLSYIQEKKQNLFEKYEANKEAMNIINLAYNFGRLTQEEFEIACFAESVCLRAQKNLGIKKIPSSSPITWHQSLQTKWANIGSNDIKAELCWKKIKEYINARAPEITQDFCNLISQHYSYEELMNIKQNTFFITKHIKKGVNLIQDMINSGLI